MEMKSKLPIPLNFTDSRFDRFWRHYNRCEAWRINHFQLLNTNSSKVIVDDSNVEEDYVENDNVEVSAELANFMQQTIDHRRQRELTKLEETEVVKPAYEWLREMADEYVDISEIGINSNLYKDVNFETPPEQIGLDRKRELDKLYGRYSESVAVIDAKMQLKFNDYLLQYHPHLWPSIPLKM